MSQKSQALVRETILQKAQGSTGRDKYKIEKKIGQGGFGITYLATMMHKKVVIKEFFLKGICRRMSDNMVLTNLDDYDKFTKFKQAFIDEAEMLSMFDSYAHIVRVTDWFEENNTAYFVMDYVEGTNLEEYCKSRGGKLPLEDVLKYMAQIVKALSAIHKKDVLHKDIKPSNIMLADSGEIVLVDFGAAHKFVDGSQVAIGTYGYASPEQMNTQGECGSYTDIYGLGATLYRLLTGEKPTHFSKRNKQETALPSAKNAAIPKGVCSAIMKAMSLAPTDRYQTVGEFMDALTEGYEDYKLIGHTTVVDEEVTLLVEDSFQRGGEVTILDKNLQAKNEVTVLGENFQAKKKQPIKTPETNYLVQVQAEEPIIKDDNRVADNRKNSNFSDGEEPQYAGFWLRLAAYIIDTVVVYFLAFCTGLFAGVILGLGQSEEDLILLYIVGMLVSVLYYAGMESSNKQATFGKLAVGIKVTDIDGFSRLSFGKAMGRFFGKIVSSVIFLIGFLMAGFTKKKQALHDMMVGCLVIKK